MKINIIRGILIIMLFGTFYLIFGFSSQNATESSTISRAVSKAVIEITNGNISEDLKLQMIQDIEPVIRKLAHFSIYTLVGFLLMTLACTYKIAIKNKIYTSLVAGFLYACSDEIHQLFIDGRSGEIRDVLIDTSGVLLGILISYLFYRVYKRCKKNMMQTA